jgi:hypothetical protein
LPARPRARPPLRRTQPGRPNRRRALRPCARRSRPAGMNAPTAASSSSSRVRPDQAGREFRQFLMRGLRPGGRRAGNRLHRPQSSQARTQLDSVRRMPDGRHRGLPNAKGVTKPSHAPANPNRVRPNSVRRYNLDGLLGLLNGISVGSGWARIAAYSETQAPRADGSSASSHLPGLQNALEPRAPMARGGKPRQSLRRSPAPSWRRFFP